MEKEFHKENDDKNAYDGAIHQITPAPDNFAPEGALNFGKSFDLFTFLC